MVAGLIDVAATDHRDGEGAGLEVALGACLRLVQAVAGGAPETTAPEP